MANASANHKTQIVYFSHGGGPLPILNDPGHQAMIDFMRRLPDRLTRPDLILVVSAHWEEPEATLQGAPNPEMFYDYYGFPEAAYEIKYPAPGSPQTAQHVAQLLVKSGIPARVDEKRGFDHGLFIPLKMMYPQADIPCLQLSLISGLDAAAHIALGQALRELNNENILVIGSGFSYHNMRGFAWGPGRKVDTANDAFQDWLIETCTGSLTQPEREQRLVNWEQAPNARYCHPREEHLLPLHVCQGIAGTPAEVIFDDLILGVRSLGFLWQP
jgi:aromatic ring-opening dioxygenase catalytic subunit (LigB family)